MIRDDFAGPGGWDEGMRLLGITDVIGVEWDTDACATRAAAGHATLQADIGAMAIEDWTDEVEGYIASPPCQLFSNAGTRHGATVVDELVEGMGQVVAGNDVRAEVRGDVAAAIHADVLADEERAEAKRRARGLAWRTDDEVNDAAAARATQLAYNACLVLEPARWVRALHPRWVALEQVPAVLPLWRQLARGLRELGYSVWVGILNAADYGVPQVRKRAVLMAHRDKVVQPPEASHARHPEPTLFGPEQQQWVSMAAALGWGITDGPALSVVAANHDGDNSSGGPRPLDGGAGAREHYRRAYAEGRWTGKVPPWVEVRRGPRPGDEPGDNLAEGFDPTAEPAQTVTGRVDRWQVHGMPELLNTGRDWKPGGTRDDAQKVPTEDPAPTITHQADAWWWVTERRNDQSGVRQADPLWPLERPATTIAGRGLVADPGHTVNRHDTEDRKSRNDGYRVEVWEAAVLQSFRHDYPWQGSRTAQFEQVGNAVPPLLARAIVQALTT